jgi:hypothetical protein
VADDARAARSLTQARAVSGKVKSNPATRFGMAERRRLSMAGRQQAGMGAGCLLALAALPFALAQKLLKR